MLGLALLISQGLHTVLPRQLWLPVGRDLRGDLLGVLEHSLQVVDPDLVVAPAHCHRDVFLAHRFNSASLVNYYKTREN